MTAVRVLLGRHGGSTCAVWAVQMAVHGGSTYAVEGTAHVTGLL